MSSTVFRSVQQSSPMLVVRNRRTSSSTPSASSLTTLSVENVVTERQNRSLASSPLWLRRKFKDKSGRKADSRERLQSDSSLASDSGSEFFLSHSPQSSRKRIESGGSWSSVASNQSDQRFGGVDQEIEETQELLKKVINDLFSQPAHQVDFLSDLRDRLKHVRFDVELATWILEEFFQNSVLIPALRKVHEKIDECEISITNAWTRFYSDILPSLDLTFVDILKFEPKSLRTVCLEAFRDTVVIPVLIKSKMTLSQEEWLKPTDEEKDIRERKMKIARQMLLILQSIPGPLQRESRQLIEYAVSIVANPYLGHLGFWEGPGIMTSECATDSPPPSQAVAQPRPTFRRAFTWVTQRGRACATRGARSFEKTTKRDPKHLSSGEAVDSVYASIPRVLHLHSRTTTTLSHNGSDDDDVVIAALKAFDEHGKIDTDNLRHLLMTFGDKFTGKECDDAFEQFPVDNNGKVETAAIISILTASAKEEEEEES
ncbi:unnamed protein product [Cyprideis torosa]|uniref:Uncharacterized protein n=1 Tax=Cyprideis torosa TaxID=163714 RepID=A0A7R8WA60_9CRUS|nr:unnamed protein product [Cyprideis torosa]CAG0889288.1 unnamed protein product [Cyprideis torosa]